MAASDGDMDAPPAPAPAPGPLAPPAPFATAVAASPVDFATQIQPLLQSRCQPCHFPGGKMYERLPFDRPATLRKLGEKVFTRIKAEDEQALIRAFLAQSADG